MRLGKIFGDHPDQYQTDDFLNFTAKMMRLQNQLDLRYHGDLFMREQLQTDVDIPAIQSSLRDRIARISEQAINRVLLKLSNDTKTAGRTMVNFVHDGHDHAHWACCHLGKKKRNKVRCTL